MTSNIRTTVPSARLTDANDAPVRSERAYVLYFMNAARRTESNFALDFAVDVANALDKPLVVLEALRTGYPHASARLHRFVLDGMADNATAGATSRATWLAYVELETNQGKGLVERLAADAAYVVTDDYPCFFLPRMVAALAKRLDVRLVKVDGNGLVPMRVVPGIATSAYHFRQRIQKLLPMQLEVVPTHDPLARLVRTGATVDATVTARWPMQTPASLREAPFLASLPIDHDVAPVPTRGGAVAAAKALEAFVTLSLGRYEDRNHPDDDTTSKLSPYLHFGHISAHTVFARVVGEGFAPRALVPNAGKREGYYKLSAAKEGFLDQLVTWRELGFHYCLHEPGYDTYASLPAWARKSLDAHAKDAREHVYDLATLDASRTHDHVWNAAQRELRETGAMHNYLRMLWGKKILEWSVSPTEAYRTMIHLNDRYALDGRDPNSYSGMGWVLGRFDRPWAPERAVYGQIRYMSSDAATKKLRMKAYLARWGRTPSLF